MFTTARSNESKQALRYLSGLLSTTRRKNMERMDEHLVEEAGCDYESMQHFISGSPWSDRDVYDFIARRADGRLGNRPDTGLIIDESAFSKKGDKSVGVGRQHNGRLGKQDNCQVGVYSVLTSCGHSAIVGARLFLPDDWINDPERCRKAGVPEEDIVPKTKIQQARELVEQACEQGLRFAYVGCDAFYGRDSTFLEWMEERGLIYCADVPANTLLFAEPPKGETRPKKMRAVTQRVDVLAQSIIAKTQPTEIDLRETENGLLRAEIWAVRVWVWPAVCEQPRCCWLIIRRMSDGSLKFSLSNAPEDTPIERLAEWQNGRFFIERTFQDAKSEAGMSEYQTRGWRAWHHHMVLVALAMLFMTEQRLLLGKSTPLISAADIVTLLDWSIAKPRTQEEAIAEVKKRHAQRQRNALNAQNRKRKKLGLPKLRKMQPKKLPK
jgi:SRSO17 transposase